MFELLYVLRSLLNPTKQLPTTKSTWSMLKNHRLIAVKPAPQSSGTNEWDCNDVWLIEFPKRLLAGRAFQDSWFLGDSCFLGEPYWPLTLHFANGEMRTITIGSRPKLTAARVVEIDGEKWVMMAPGLPEYEDMRPWAVETPVDSQPSQQSSTEPSSS
jgi:hypothetical protein